MLREVDVVLDDQDDAAARQRDRASSSTAARGRARRSTSARSAPAAAGEARGPSARRSGRRAASEPLGQRQREGAAAAGRAVERELAAQQARQIARDREPEPGAAVLAVGGAVGLTEGLEDDLVLLGGDADAGVLDLERDPAPGRRANARARPRPRSVNFSAFDSRFFRICCSRVASVTMVRGHVRRRSRRSSSIPLSRATGWKTSRQLVDAAAPARSSPAARPACRPRSWTGRGCR